MTYKIAATSEDGVKTGMHFGHTPCFVIFTVEDGKIIDREIRKNTFTPHMRQGGHHEHGAGHNHHQGHNCGSAVREGLADCSVLICGGIGQGAINMLQAAGMKLVKTRFATVEESIEVFLGGELNDPASPCKDHSH